MIQLALFPDPKKAPPKENKPLGPAGTSKNRPWPFGTWLRAYTTSLRDSGTTTIGRLNGYSLDPDGKIIVLLINAHGSRIVPITRVCGVISPTDASPRVLCGFPRTCPTGYAEPVLAKNCHGCQHRVLLPRGVWYCNHAEHQAAPGVHFCWGCGRELGPYFESQGWEHCGGSRGKCIRHPPEHAGSGDDKKGL